MKYRTLLIIAALLTLTVSSMAGQSTAAETGSASWPVFMADPSHTSRSTTDTSGNPGQAINWVPYWATGNASVVVSDRGTYFASTGMVLYRLNADHTAMNRYVGNDSLMGTPAIGWNDSAYVGSLDRSIYSLDGNGTKWWQYNTSAPVWSSPTIVQNNTLFVTSAGLMSFTLDGRLNWRALQNVTSRSSPAVSDNGNIYFGAEDGKLYAIDHSGSLLWSFQTSGPVRASPSIDGAGNVHFGSDDGNVYCLSQDGTLIWFYFTGLPVRSSIGIRSDGWSMLLTGNGSLIAFDMNGSVGWTLKLDGYNVTRSLAIDSQGICYVGSDTTMYSVQVDGKVRWTYRISTGFVGSPAITKNGTLVFGSSTGLFELGHVDEGNEGIILAAVLVPPLALCAVLIYAARRLRRVKAVEKKDK
jgi:outer membrane protein assembly factor BamB